MISFYKKILIYKYLIILAILIPNFNNAKEILIYADNISYDEEQNIIARGNAKIFQKNQLIISDLIIYNVDKKEIVLPGNFTFKDSLNNFYNGENGFFSLDLKNAEFEKPMIKLNDGSRLIGKKIKRDGNIDIISKGVYTPCKSRIKVGNFICPTWQLEGEKILHDNKNLFLYQKHSKMRVINTPVFYIPYIVTPSPLRKDRKTGFLTPSISLNFFDTKTSQSLAFPYYFNISMDKELLFTPVLNYGGGVDTSQRFIFDYNQLLSGGKLQTNLSFDSNFEKSNNNNWLTNASLINSYEKNLNTNYRVKINSALQTSEDYIQITKPNDDLSYTTSLSTKINLEGFNLNKKDDYFIGNISFYQSNQENEDNKTIPMVLPNLKYYSGLSKNDNFNSSINYEFYNIIREKNTSIHSKQQQKLSHKYFLKKDLLNFNSQISMSAEIYNQLFNTENKLVKSEKLHNGGLYRLFPIFSIYSETPFKLKKLKYDLIFKPITQIVISPGSSNSNKLSNEDSTNNNFTIENAYSLNRYSGNDKIDNSKRFNYGIDIYNENLKLNIFQTYEFTDNSNFHQEQGNENNLSDLLGSLEYNNINKLNYNFRYDLNSQYLKNQSANIKTTTKIGNLELYYLDQQSKVDGIVTKDAETINYKFQTKKFAQFSKLQFQGLYDLKKEISSEYSIGYSYFDECFGINLDFIRKSYHENELKPQDILTIMFSFKNIGSYKSNNLVVSEGNQQDVKWENISIDNKLFDNNE